MLCKACSPLIVHAEPFDESNAGAVEVCGCAVQQQVSSITNQFVNGTPLPAAALPAGHCEHQEGWLQSAGEED